MCGIAGAVGPGLPPNPAVRRAVLDAIAHRGPDSDGELIRDGAWLGFRRLAILDLGERANQPFVDDETGVALVFNGEIYNYVELREALRKLGHEFRTTGDTEVLLRGYIEWGEGVFARSNGMWALAIHDPRRRGLLLSRDRFGEKPLHVGRDANRNWWFASEPGALRAAGVGPGRIDRARVEGFLLLGDIEDPTGSYFQGIAQLPPGTSGILSEHGLHGVGSWFDLAAEIERDWACDPASEEEVRDAMQRAVALRLRSDVPVGTSLSGGLDSSALVASVRGVAGDREMHAFTASFPGHAVDEWDRAERVAKQYDLALHRVEPTVEGFVADLDEVVRHQGAPIESPTVYAQWCVMRRAREEGVTVLLDGQGADETWGGYLKYVGYASADAKLRGRFGEADCLEREWVRLGGMPEHKARQTAGLALPPFARGILRNLYRRFGAGALGPSLRATPLRDPQGGALRGPLLRRGAQVDLERVLLPRLLRYADRNSMAWSREIRLPFLDMEMVRMGFRADWFGGLKLGWSKYGLRKAFDDLLPSEVVWRREKTAYEAPKSWATSPEVAEMRGEAERFLAQVGVIVPGSGLAFDPFRLISLARFMLVFDLRT